MRIRLVSLVLFAATLACAQPSLNLAARNTVEGLAGTATAVTFTIFGLDCILQTGAFATPSGRAEDLAPTSVIPTSSPSSAITATSDACVIVCIMFGPFSEIACRDNNS